jgi:hypothetical protein
MTSFLARYRDRLRIEHGWEAEVACPSCGAVAVPVYHGWTPTQVIRFGDAPTVYAELSCPRCGADLKEAAGRRLVELFADIPIPRSNRRTLAIFVAFVLVASLGGAIPALGWRYLGLSPGWRDVGVALMRIPLLLLAPAIFWLNWGIASIRHRCACGRPDYKLMGLIGRSYAFRCSTCGRLLRLRD